jgi:hypothetical protein
MGFGSPRWSAQNGAGEPLSKYASTSESTETKPTETKPPTTTLSNDAVLHKRTEFLEKEGKHIKESVYSLKSEGDQVKRKTDVATRALHLEMQWVFGKTKRANVCGRAKWNDPTSETKIVATKPGSRLLLVYPMKECKVSDDHTQYLMRCKMVDRMSGQLSMIWVVVHETLGTKETRYVGEFTFE